MEQDIKISIIDHFSAMDDIRRKPLHQLSEILTIVICAVIAGADSIVGVYKWSEQHENWLKKILTLPYGIPSHDTISRILSIMDPKEFEQAFVNWTNAVFQKTKGDIIPIDGKIVRGSYDKNSGVSAINVVGAYSTANKALLGHVKTETKSNEITAIPELLSLLDINGCIITIDAIGCQTRIAADIVDKKGDYVLAVKDNQPNLHKEIINKFQSDSNSEKDNYKTEEQNRERYEIREYSVIDNIDKLNRIKDFKGCKAIGKVKSTRIINNETSTESRYFILSFKACASEFANCVRSHWRIENSVHWLLDVGFREDKSRIRKDNTPSNMSTIRRVALNMLKQEKTEKVGIENKRKIAGWNVNYLEKVLNIC